MPSDFARYGLLPTSWEERMRLNIGCLRQLQRCLIFLFLGVCWGKLEEREGKTKRLKDILESINS